MSEGHERGIFFSWLPVVFFEEYLVSRIRIVKKSAKLFIKFIWFLRESYMAHHRRKVAIGDRGSLSAERPRFGAGRAKN
jgi:hypothetical protein